MENYLGLLLLIGFAALTAGGFIALTHWLGPRRHGLVHDMPFECGNRPRRIMGGRVGVKFFLVAILFILFDVELVFLFPWAVIYKELGLFGFVEMFIFLLVVLSGLYYSVKKGALEWK
ncbi:MAG: NADH-quinone oxidoreductase subunit A [Acidobacteria bacterium]|nr:NADH-quinone oxidoreductase subunit A [Acidobacteriota bacterium]